MSGSAETPAESGRELGSSPGAPGSGRAPEERVDFEIGLPRGISWTLFNRATQCQKKVEFHRKDVRQRNRDWPTYYADVGTGVQRVFELYFNQQVNLRPDGQSPSTVAACAEKVLTRDKFLRDLFDATTYPDGKTRMDLFAQVRSDVASGLHAIHSAGFLGELVRCEVPAPGRIRGWPTFGSIDFLVLRRDGAEEVWDGKAMSATTADPDQVRWYTLSRVAEGRKVARGGIVYFRQGVARPVDVSTDALRAFASGRFASTEDVWRALKEGASSLPATPREGRSTCYRCEWRDHCPESLTRRLPPDIGGPSEIGFDYAPERGAP